MQFDSYIVSDTKTAFSVPIFDKTNIKIKNNKSFKHFAFTLAETLITLTIIGVIAALTVPNLLNKYTKHTYVIGLKKAYSQLQHAVKMIPITEGCSAGDYDCAGFTTTDQYESSLGIIDIDGQNFGGNANKKNAYLLSKQFKIQKLCYELDNNDCNYKIYSSFGSTYSGSIFNTGSQGEPTFITNDNILITVYNSSIAVDINGTKGPNKFGRDVFFFHGPRHNNIENHFGIIPLGSKESTKAYDYTYYWKENNYCSTESVNNNSRQATFCTGRVLEEDAMNY